MWSWGRMYDFFLHSFGRARDRFSPPTLNLKRTTIDVQEKGDEFGNEDQRRQACKTNDLDALNERARNEKDSIIRS